MRRLLAPLILLAAAAAAVAGCGGGSGNGGGGGTSSSGAAPAAATTAATTTQDTASSSKDSGKSVEVRLQNIAFSPKTVKVKAGQEIEWENYDSVAHNVTATGGASFQSPTMAKDAKFSFTPKTAGTISYVCTFHPGMTAQIVVTS